MSYLISLILLLSPTYLIRFDIAGIPTTVLETLIYIVFLSGLWRGFKDGLRQIPWKIWLPLGLLIITLIISTAISADKRTALGEFKGFFIDPLLVFWLIFQHLKKEDIPKLFLGLITSGLFVAIHTIVQKFLGHTTPDGRVIGIFGYSPNYVALFLAPIAVMTAGLLTTDYGLPRLQNKYLRWSVVGLLLAILLLAIYFSGSRGGFLALAGGMGIFIILHYWSWIQTRLAAKIIIGILMVMTILTAWTLFQPDFSASPLTGGRETSSNNVRWQIWGASIELGTNHPILGVGLGNFQNAFGDFTKTRANFPEYITPMALTPHNIFLMFWLSTGLLGLAAFLWLLVNFYCEGSRKLSGGIFPIILAVMSTIVFYGFIEASIWKNDLSLIFWTFWALIWII